MTAASIDYLPADIRARANRIRDYRRYREAGVGITLSAQRAWGEPVDEPCGKLFADAVRCAIDLADELDRRESIAAEHMLPVDREWLLTLPGAKLEGTEWLPESERCVEVPCGRFVVCMENPGEVDIVDARYAGRSITLLVTTRASLLDVMRVLIIGSGAGND